METGLVRPLGRNRRKSPVEEAPVEAPLLLTAPDNGQNR
jgi:hypothetical protein